MQKNFPAESIREQDIKNLFLNILRLSENGSFLQNKGEVTCNCGYLSILHYTLEDIKDPDPSSHVWCCFMSFVLHKWVRPRWLIGRAPPQWWMQLNSRLECPSHLIVFLQLDGSEKLYSNILK